MNSDWILQYFEYKHLPKELQLVSAPFHKLAHDMIEKMPSNPARVEMLQSLLISKDWAVRSMIFQTTPK